MAGVWQPKQATAGGTAFSSQGPRKDHETFYLAVITGPDHVQVSLRRDRQTGRLYVSGHYPPSHYYFKKGERGHIGVSYARGPHTIATEITKRLLPKVRLTTEKVRAYDEVVRLHTSARMNLIDRIRDLFAANET